MNSVRDFFQVLRAIIWKDLKIEWRNRELISGMLMFALLMILIFNFALELESHTSAGLSAGVLWVTLIYSGAIGINRSILSERENNCLDGLLLAPTDRSAIFFGKAVGIWVVMLAASAVLLPVYSLLYSVFLLKDGFFLVIILGTAGYALAGTLLAGMSAQSRARDSLLPLLLLPVTFPLILASVKASTGLLQGFALADVQTWISLLVVYDILFIVLGLLLFERIVEE